MKTNKKREHAINVIEKDILPKIVTGTVRVNDVEK